MPAAGRSGGGGGGPPWRAARPQTRLAPGLASSPSLRGAEGAASASGRGRVEGGALDCGPAPPPQAPRTPNSAAATHQGSGGGRCRRRRGAGREPSWCSTSVDCCSGRGWAAACGRACWVPVGRRQGRTGEGGGRTRRLVPMRRARAMVRRWRSTPRCAGGCVAPCRRPTRFQILFTRRMIGMLLAWLHSTCCCSFPSHSPGGVDQWHAQRCCELGHQHALQ